jgi:hypothetical protein
MQFKGDISKWAETAFLRFIEKDSMPMNPADSLLKSFVRRTGNSNHFQQLFEMFSVTHNHEVSRSYLSRTHWILEQAVNLYFTEASAPLTEQGNQNKVALIEMDIVTGDRVVSERFLRQANWDLQEAMTQFIEQLSSSQSRVPQDSERLVSQFFDVTGDNEVSVNYLKRVNWDYDAAVKLFLEEAFEERAANSPPQPEVRPNEMILVLRLIEVTGDEGKAREYLVRTEWNEEAAIKLALRELFGIDE